MYTLLVSWVSKAHLNLVRCNHYQWLRETLFDEKTCLPITFYFWKTSSNYVFQFHWTYHPTNILQGLVFITWSEEFLAVFRLWIAFEKLLSYNYRQLNTCQLARKWNHVKSKDKYAVLVKHWSIKTVNAHF